MSKYSYFFVLFFFLCSNHFKYFLWWSCYFNFHLTTTILKCSGHQLLHGKPCLGKASKKLGREEAVRLTAWVDPPSKRSGKCKKINKLSYLGLFSHFIKDKMGQNFHKIEAVRLEGGDPPSPPQAVSLTAFFPFFLLITSLSIWVKCVGIWGKNGLFS